MTHERIRKPTTTNAEFWVEIIRNCRDKYREGLTNQQS